jgi:hypothetical protein
MPQILIVTDPQGEAGITVYRERIESADLKSEHFSGQLVERVGWAVEDADRIERDGSATVKDTAPAGLLRAL